MSTTVIKVPTGSKRGFKVTSAHILATWDMKSKNDVCLCTRPLTAPPKDELTSGGISESIDVGTCGHAFHKSCITSYLASNEAMCPKCKPNAWSKANATNSAVASSEKYKVVTKLVAH